MKYKMNFSYDEVIKQIDTLANQFLFFGNVLIDELFDSWVKQCLEIDE